MEMILRSIMLKYHLKKDNLFKVSLTNQVNNHEQIILRNNDGVYVLTPSIGKVLNFKVIYHIIIPRFIYCKHY